MNRVYLLKTCTFLQNRLEANYCSKLELLAAISSYSHTQTQFYPKSTLQTSLGSPRRLDQNSFSGIEKRQFDEAFGTDQRTFSKQTTTCFS